ncbi:MAG: hypothetical protein EPO10_26395 [Reyranella sp.]|nr:MAG: hypothetical protein EPO10_26395 [Reyranella sp.]
MPQLIHRESLEEEATHATDEARMVLPGVQAIMGFQLIAVFNQRFETLAPFEQWLHLAAFFLVTLAMGLIMAPAAYHRQMERGCVTRRFVDLASRLLTLSLPPLILGLAFDAFILVRLAGGTAGMGLVGASTVAVILAGLWFLLPRLIGRQSDGS